ncbi:hypothetical protein D3C85_724250 [compost metagenome]
MTDKKPSPIRGITKPPEPVRKFWWMVAGDVFFHMGNPEETQIANLNSILSTEGPAISSQALGRAQAGLVQRLHDTNKEAKFHVVDVRFGAISGLGHMSDEEFFGPAKATESGQ